MTSSTTQQPDNSFHIPEFSLKLPFNKKFPEPHRPFKVSITEGLRSASLGIRMLKNVHEFRSKDRVPAIDPTKMRGNGPGPIFGVPCGGLGAGSVTRGWRGEFNRFQLLEPGLARVNDVPADLFAVSVRRATGATVSSPPPSTATATKSAAASATATVLRGSLSKPPAPALKPFVWNGVRDRDAGYAALFPRAWTQYRAVAGTPISLCCKQISPVIPHNYEASCMPVCVFVWNVENTSKEDDCDVTLMFSFQNGDGSASDAAGGHVHKSWRATAAAPPSAAVAGDEAIDDEEGNLVAVVMNHKRRLRVTGDAGKDVGNGASATSAASVFDQDVVQLAIAAHVDAADASVSYCPRWTTNDQSDARQLWQQLKTGDLAPLNKQQPGKPGSSNGDSGHSPSIPGQTVGAAVSVRLHVPAGQSRQCKFVLAWHVPVARFRNGLAHPRFYTRQFGQECDAPLRRMIVRSIQQWPAWERQIDAWQQPILTDKTLTPAYKHGLFNELYYLVDGGTLWTADDQAIHLMVAKIPGDSGDATAAAAAARLRSTSASVRVGGVSGNDGTDDASTVTVDADEAERLLTHALNKKKEQTSGSGSGPRSAHMADTGQSQASGSDAAAVDVDSSVDVGHFVLLEGLEYLMYNTVDVLFYGSWALAVNWPAISRSMTADIALAVATDEPELRQCAWNGTQVARKAAGAVPHDLGNPGDDGPWHSCNAYIVQNTARWKDLPCKFVLSVYRDWKLGQQQQQQQQDCLDRWLRQLWPTVQSVISRTIKFDSDNDGVIDNEGFPDQTYDTWSVTGCSAYSGGLWLAALQAVEHLARHLGDHRLAANYRSTLLKGIKSFEAKLWNGSFYNYDQGSSAGDAGSPASGGAGNAASSSGSPAGSTSAADRLSMPASSSSSTSSSSSSSLPPSNGSGIASRSGNQADDDDASDEQANLSPPPTPSTIMSDQLAGHWYAVACGLPGIVPLDNARSALYAVFQNNVMKFRHGDAGAMNGWNVVTDQPDSRSLQSGEVWIGTTFTVAAAMTLFGFSAEGRKTMDGMLNCLYSLGYFFQTPEALDKHLRFRSGTYLRPLAIWAYEHCRQLNLSSSTSKAQPLKPAAEIGHVKKHD